MRPTSITGDSLRERAAKRSGDKDNTARVRAGVEASNAAEAGRRLAALGGTEPKLRPIPRRRDQA
ncbi:MAG: type II toxin-antitoxin system VapB family antitoxin [Bryobacterales bacterium]|nr:type II toxin-antitoxin system VapB family antitoxin [Bryobacterales bacterium]